MSLEAQVYTYTAQEEMEPCSWSPEEDKEEAEEEEELSLQWEHGV